MATIVLQAAGAFLGGFLGSTGAAIGSAAGAIAGYVLDQTLINGTKRIEGPRLDTARPFTAEDGASLPRIYGTIRTGGTMMWATRFEEAATTTRQGFKGGPRVTEYSYFANVAFALCEGPISGVRRIWADGRELDQSLFELRVHAGGDEQEPDPLIEAKQGEGNAPAYRGTAYIVFERFPLDEYGNRIPQFQFEVIRAVGRTAADVRAVALIPGSTEYGLSPGLVTRKMREGETLAVNRHALSGESDLMASLDELQALCPNLEHVAIVVAWFGDDLRAGHCLIRPAVTDAEAEGFSVPWTASGVGRHEAYVVSRHEGAAAYGGSPSDRSVIDAIAEIGRRGLKATLYPFVMMDIAADNDLPDPHGGARQAAYPWRGRVTCDPAPLATDTADATAAARAQVEAFCGAAGAGDFAAGEDTVLYFGADWGYRRFILHLAHLAKLAGGVDAFLLGSELRGLTTLRDEANAFPFVEQLCDLAAEVRGILGTETKITYGADWSEYFGHHPQDGSSDVFFHLDPLWAHPAIDAVGIDNYMPLSDWRDADYAGGNPDGFAAPYDPDGLRSMIAGGEGFDWYYADEAARLARDRTPIADGAHGKHWTFRYKDLAGWWSNLHHDRIGGVEAALPSAWTPGAKPIWLTELGCPAVDKGPNQPNVFPDPKSAESAAPYFSSNGRSDLAQRRFIAAHQEYWNPQAATFEEARNPAASAYAGRMLDCSRIYLWAWDARPFPAYPLLRDEWRDGDDWTLGHWLNGRLDGIGIADLVNAILADHGLPPALADNADGALQGYVVTDPTSARAALAPIVDLFDLAVREDGDRLVFSGVGASAGAPVAVEELVDEGGDVFEATRTPDNQLPVEAILGYRNPFAEHQSASARAVRTGAAGARQETIGFPGAMASGVAEALVADWLARRWSSRERVGFGLAAGEVEVAPGTVISLPSRDGANEYVVEAVEEGLTRRVSARQIVRMPPSPAIPALSAPPAAVPMFGPPLALFLDLPMGPGAAAPQDQFRIAAWTTPWRSQAAFASPESSGFTRRATLPRPATVGKLVEALRPGPEGRIDHAATLVVALSGGELGSVSRLRVLNGANAAAIVTAAGGLEIVQFESAEEVAPDTWRLTGLLRGQLGTGAQAGEGAAAGSRFVLLDEAIQPAGLSGSETGLTLNWRVGPSGRDVSPLHYTEVTAAGGVRALTPLSPVHIRGVRNGGDLVVTWIRRGRIDADNWAAADIPLGEEAESYQVEVSPAGGPPVRSIIAAMPAWTYPAASIAEDFAALPQAIEVSVRQISAAVGPGLPGRAQFELS
jgi:hypothetical protein